MRTALYSYADNPVQLCGQPCLAMRTRAGWQREEEEGGEEEEREVGWGLIFVSSIIIIIQVSKDRQRCSLVRLSFPCFSDKAVQR